MKTAIVIKKEDIKTKVLGKNISINPSEDFQIIFEPDALNELLVDYKTLIKTGKLSDEFMKFIIDKEYETH